VQDALGALHDRARPKQRWHWPATARGCPPAREAKDLARRLRALLAARSEPRTELIAQARHALAREKAQAGWWA
jgi:hypothetical protein